MRGNSALTFLLSAVLTIPTYTSVLEPSRCHACTHVHGTVNLDLTLDVSSAGFNWCSMSNQEHRSIELVEKMRMSPLTKLETSILRSRKYKVTGDRCHG